MLPSNKAPFIGEGFSLFGTKIVKSVTDSVAQGVEHDPCKAAPMEFNFMQHLAFAITVVLANSKAALTSD